MEGVASNLTAMLEDRYHRGNYGEVSDKADAPLEDAVATLLASGIVAVNMGVGHPTDFAKSAITFMSFCQTPSFIVTSDR